MSHIFSSILSSCNISDHLSIKLHNPHGAVAVGNPSLKQIIPAKKTKLREVTTRSQLHSDKTKTNCWQEETREKQRAI